MTDNFPCWSPRSTTITFGLGFCLVVIVGLTLFWGAEEEEDDDDEEEEELSESESEPDEEEDVCIVFGGCWFIPDLVSGWDDGVCDEDEDDDDEDSEPESVLLSEDDNAMLFLLLCFC